MSGAVLRTCLALVALLAGSGVAVAEEAPPADDVPLSRSTQNWLFPSGETLDAGETQFAFHDFVYGELSHGLTDRLEISVSLPVVPLIGSLGARYSLLSKDSALRLVVGASAWWAFDLFGEEDDPAIAAVVGTVTLAYQTERFNLHVTGAFSPPDEEDGDAFGVTNAGLTFRIAPRAALMAEMAELQYGDRERSDKLRFTVVGLKILRPAGALDLGMMYVDDPNDRDGDGEGVWLPVLSVTQRY